MLDGDSYLFAIASMASGKREGIPFIIYRLFVIFVSGTVIAVTVPDILIFIDYGKDSN